MHISYLGTPDVLRMRYQMYTYIVMFELVKLHMLGYMLLYPSNLFTPYVSSNMSHRDLFQG